MSAAETLFGADLSQSAGEHGVATTARLAIARHFQIVYNSVVGIIYIQKYSKKRIQFFFGVTKIFEFFLNFF